MLSKGCVIEFFLRLIFKGSVNVRIQESKT